jgi:hypothetical protein
MGLRNPSLFDLKYTAVDMTWIDNFSDFFICLVEHSIDKLKRTTSNKTVDMMLLTLTMHHADVSVNITVKVKFIFEDVLKLVFNNN